VRGRSRAGSRRAQPGSVPPPRVRVAVASESAPVRIEHVAHGVSRRAARREVSREAESVICSRIATRPRWMGQGVTRCHGHGSAARYRVVVVHPLVRGAYPMAADHCHELLYRHAIVNACVDSGSAGESEPTPCGITSRMSSWLAGRARTCGVTIAMENPVTRTAQSLQSGGIVASQFTKGQCIAPSDHWAWRRSGNCC
jgi:hypothetical protein